MGDRLATARAGFTALGVVLLVAISFFLVVAIVAFGIGTIWGAVFGGGSPADAGAQSPTFNLTHDDGAVTVSYEAGEPLAAEEVFVVVDGDHRGSWAEHDPDGEAIEPGDAITIDDVQEGDEVLLQAVGDDEVTDLHRETV